MKTSLPNNIYTSQDLKALIIEVRRYAQWYRQTSVKNQVGGAHAADPLEVTAEASELINNWAKQQNLTADSLDKLISELEAYENKAPRIVITLAGPAPGSLKRSMAEWCRKNIAPNILVDFRFNATLLGGMVVQFGSHIHDWSFRRSIMANRDKFPEILRNV